MRSLVTIISCGCLAWFGAHIGALDIVKPSNTANAQVVNLDSILHPITVHDTIKGDTVRDTLPPKVITRIKYKTVKVPCDHNDSVLIDSSLKEARKGTPPDTIPTKAKWYKLHGIVEPMM